MKMLIMFGMCLKSLTLCLTDGSLVSRLTIFSSGKKPQARLSPAGIRVKTAFGMVRNGSNPSSV